MARQLPRSLLLATLTILPLPCGASPIALDTLYSFKGGSDGGGPRSLLASHGALYGTSHHSGSTACYGDGCGTMFKINPETGAETQLHAFQGAPDDGSYLTAGLTSGNGMLYGTTSTGGTENLGTIYRYDPGTGTETVLYNFKGYPADGSVPAGTLLIRGGAIYGTTTYGGPGCGAPGCGTVFAFDIGSGTERVLHGFAGGADGAAPTAGLIYQAGAFYGTTQGGDVPADFGTVFKLVANQGGAVETVIHALQGAADGAYPAAALLYLDGALYGTTQGGDTNADYGTVFSIRVEGVRHVETILHRFQAGLDGAVPQAGLTHIGNYLYGTTVLGGALARGKLGHGTVYKLDLGHGTETVLYRFYDKTDGLYPEAPLLAYGNAIYGTTFFGGVGCGGEGCGTVFRFTP